MEVPNQEEAEMPIPLNSTYGGGGHGHVHLHGHPIIHHHHHHPSHNHHITTIPPSSSSSSPPPHPHQIIPPMDDDNNHAVIVPFKRMPVIKYRECLKNHAASMGGNANDGCGEFMPSGEEGTLEALTCSACSCHRNFHRKEIDGGSGSGDNPITGRKVFVGHHHPHHHHHHAALGYQHLHHSRPQHQMIMSYNMGGGGGGGSLPSESDEQDGGGGGGGVVRPPQILKKRFRTKFSQEQKEKMLSFAERVGWKIQKQEEGVVQNFCQEIGVKRRVLKVWMHNNKHSLAKKNANHQSVDHGGGGDDGDQNQV